MAILKIARMGHPVLRGTARPVEDPLAPEIQSLIADMTETMIDANGAGLAAPQVHVPLRLVIFRPPAETEAEVQGEPGNRPEPGPLQVLINPVISPLSQDREGGWEGCLSLPGFMGWVPRYSHIRYLGADGCGQPVDREVSGFHARVVQHECDHLDGMLYPQRMEDMSRFGYVEEMQKARAPRDGE